MTPSTSEAGRLRATSAATSGATRDAATDVAIADSSIRLGQLLKLVGLVGDGGEARAVLDSGAVQVDGQVETRRGRQVRPGDVVTAPGHDGSTVTLTVSHR